MYLKYLLISTILLVSVPKWVIVTGDSIVSGVGDSVPGGYVTRIQLKNSKNKFINQGVAGIASYDLYRRYFKALHATNPSKLKSEVQKSNKIFIDVGRNDYWSRRSPNYTVKNILKLKYLLLTHSKARVYINCLLPTLRVYQKNFLNIINKSICTNNSPRFDKLPIKYLHKEGLHPTSVGYGYLANILNKFLKGH